MSDGRWPVGESELQNLIEAGELEEVEPSPEHAQLLMRQAETHLAARSGDGPLAIGRASTPLNSRSGDQNRHHDTRGGGPDGR
jgi:hypothetical protein